MLAALADRCHGPLGRELVLALPFAATRDEARAWLAQSMEARRLLDDGSALPPGASDDVRDAVERVRVGGALAPEELRAVGRALGAARALRRFLASRRASAPALYDACSTDPTLDDAADEIDRSFEPDGALSDSASPRLRELRAEWRAARQRMLARMQDLIARHGAILQDAFVTEREGRWVLPVRSDAHERFPGIVHATSASGSTLFVEPRAVVAMGNRLKVLEADVRREEAAVYARLTAVLADVLPSLEAAVHALALADARAATARLAADLAMTFPEVVDEPRLDLRRARHPLLALDALAARPPGTVVPSDLVLEAGRCVVVSGPNAGGKTVALKTMGLVALMARAGLPAPCDEGSVVGLFDAVLTDVGDDQSLQRNLSTFSAHVSNLAEILRETTRGALVLLDELAGGTDPREGEALAAGVLDSLCARGGAVAATTHYEGLKALALVDPRFENASVGFDLPTMTPTFALARGIPGRSSALAVARRFGMPSTVIERAERFLTREDRSFEAVVEQLHGERAALELARAAAQEREQEALAARTRLEAEVSALRDRERRTLSEEARALLAQMQRAREELREAHARIRAKKADAQSIREAERAVERVAGDFAIGGQLERLVVPAARGPEREPEARAPQLRRGARVWVARLRAEGEILELLGDGQVRVAAGALKLTVPAAELRAAASPEPPPGPRRAAAPEPAPARAAAPEATPIQTEDATCDLRGLRVDDALSLATSFLDRSLNEGRRAVFFVHGHGTGALRDAVRQELARSPYVARFRAGDPDRGGEGVTVAWLT